MPHPRDLTVSAVQYELPADRIAQHPPADRGSSRLLVYREGMIEDRTFADLPGLLPATSLLVMNDTRVVNARLHFHKDTGARIEVFCLEPAHGGAVEEAFQQVGEAEWRCALGNAKRWKQGPLGQLFRSPHGDVKLFAERSPDDGYGPRVRFNWLPEGLTFAEVLARAGQVPLPPYMHRDAVVEDQERYQTVFARSEGSVAAPTAGLHFTSALLDALREHGIQEARVTLHVGAGTFLPVHADTMAGHSMHRERILVGREAVQLLHDSAGARPIVVTGTTSLRTIESLYWHGARILRGSDPEELQVDQWEPYEGMADDGPGVREAVGAVLRWMDDRGMDQVTGSTALLIAPGYRMRLADALITNFHQPGSTLLLLVAACVGPDWRRIYDHALSGGYRFLSYGDASLLWVRRP
ncbi:MAG: S-adenosylmethionine:tRNA ribosyltransferase-isomerase [Flavobacteriales bacterium]|jgi:S-adenosylmethionine:tRNA ribosyltransferase-isomerase|nr:S-adenosylmethionine:tRNA ribosyltransferase-isomerase [Flavobacteriales bacterium]MBK7940978.1 S-adenosylmethionine:tRNA ribosyltransferase-isomerase [Flavobacteriales bacterium]MBK9701598.1 S-adenosylmethionine:tRNA ribosyltransferase-isomerase [Flavobacteriales bacterium]